MEELDELEELSNGNPESAYRPPRTRRRDKKELGACKLSNTYLVLS
jgi:hypothetical protein